MLSKGIEKGAIGMPVEPTTTFSTEDKEVIAYLKCSNLTGEHKLRWEWYDPNGKLYLSTGNYPLYTSSGKYVKEATAWHRLAIRDEKATGYPGDWRVEVYLDGERMVSQNFKIEGKPDLINVVRNAPQSPADKNKWAFIIGIEKYGKAVPALFAERDASLMKEYFVKFYGVPEDHIITLLNEKATLGNIKDAVEDSLQFLTPENTLYFYYSGHGAAKRISEYRPDEGIPYLLPHDGNPYNLEGTGYSLEALYLALDRLKAKNIYAFLDACFSGNVTGRYIEGKKELIEGVKAVEFPVIKDPLLLSRKIVSFTSSKWNQISNSDPKARYGLFTYYLVKSMADKESIIKADGKVTVGELYEYVKEKVHEASILSGGLGRAQEPGIQPLPLDEIKDFVIWGK